MKQIAKNIFFFITLAILIQSCEKKIEFELKNVAPKITVNSEICPDSLCKVFLAKSILSNEAMKFNSVKNANVEIWQNNVFLGVLNTYKEVNSEAELAYYTNPSIKVNAGDNLDLKISHPDFNSVNAKTIIPKNAPKIENIEIHNFNLEKEAPTFPTYRLTANMKIILKDIDTARNYYAIKFFYIADYTLDNHFEEIEEDTTFIVPVTFELNAVSNYIIAYSENDGVIFSDEAFEGGLETISIIINDHLFVKYHDCTEFYMEIKSISKDYYLYQKTMREHYLAMISPFANLARVYSNIENGYGIFAGYNSIIDTIRYVENK